MNIHSRIFYLLFKELRIGFGFWVGFRVRIRVSFKFQAELIKK